MDVRDSLRAAAWFCLCFAQAGCSRDSPRVSPDEIARAESIYRQCVEDELGLTLLSLELAPGEIRVAFTEQTSEQDQQRALELCEPRIGFVLDPGAGAVLGPPPNLGRPASDRELHALVDARAELGFEGAVLVEVEARGSAREQNQAGTRRLSAGFGRLRPGDRRAPDSATAFDCGSIMKKVTAALIFLLEQEGALSRAQTLGELFPAAPPSFRAATVAQVLEHRAGFHPYHDTEGDFEPMDRASALTHIFAQEPRFVPGSDVAYSNSGYTLLAALVEDLTAQDFRTAARQRLFAVVGMTRSGFYGDGLWEDGNVAVGRAADVYGDNDPAHWPEPSWALMGNGGLVSTLADLLRLAKALDGDELFNAETRARYRASQPAGRIERWDLLGYAGGNDFGFNVVVAQVPDDATYVLVASHVRGPISAEILGVELVQSLYGAIAELPQVAE
jgi:CubicO group peptidase (beta-lactamase class C family)